GRKPMRRVENLALGGPTGHQRPPTFKCPPCRQAALGRHRINLERPLVLCRESQGLPIWRKGCARFLAWMTRQPLGDATLDPDPPQIALCREDNRVAVNRGKTIIALGRFISTNVATDP